MQRNVLQHVEQAMQIIPTNSRWASGGNLAGLSESFWILAFIHGYRLRVQLGPDISLILEPSRGHIQGGSSVPGIWTLCEHVARTHPKLVENESCSQPTSSICCNLVNRLPIECSSASPGGKAENCNWISALSTSPFHAPFNSAVSSFRWI
jgi:hypothetical protein